MKNTYIKRYEKKFDLFQKGNYVGSYDSKREIEEFLSKISERYVKYGIPSGFISDVVEYMNSQKYSVVESEYPVFEALDF